MKVKDLAICLRAVNYSDTSQVVTLLARQHGKIGAMAKGSRRPRSAFDGAIELFSYGQVMFTASDNHDKLSILTEFTQIPKFRLLRTNLSSMNAGLFALELTEAFCEQSDPHPALFDALAEALDALQHSADDAAVLQVLVGYQMTLLGEAGIAPLLEACGNCGSVTKNVKEGLYFSAAANGLLCPDCEQSFVEKRRISTACVALLGGTLPSADATRPVLAEAEQMLILYFTALMRRTPKMAGFFLGR